ncbi:MAG: hypothetical protein ORN49_07865 [Rhodobacteraceae bacterium]|nr:hypothetical protein [Paracoccaceae bacterium]
MAGRKRAQEAIPQSESDTAAEAPLSEVVPEMVAPQGEGRPAPEPVIAATPARTRPFWTQVLAGVVTAALGFGAAVGAYRFAPELIGGPGSSATDQRLADQEKLLSDLAVQLGDLSVTAGTDPSAALADQAATLAALRADQGKLQAQLAKLTERIDMLRLSPNGETAANVSAATRAAEQARLQAEKLEADARRTALRADRTAALAAMAVALETGQPLDPTLGRLVLLNVALPAALTDQAQGVPTLAALRDSFPQAAREALALSLPETAGEGLWARLGAFLRSQAGLRSLTPRAGTDPDAVLSRAEAALGTGDLAATLAEIATLPEAGRTRMAEWVGRADHRQAALAAFAALQAEGQ